MTQNAEAKRIAEAYARRSESVPVERYSPFELSNLLRIQELERKLLQLIGHRLQKNLQYKTILDVGCGAGHWLRQFIQWGAKPSNLAGVDILPDRITLARELCPAQVHLECEDASQLRFPDSSFDLVWQATVFSSILEPQTRSAVAREMQRVLRPNGLILWYDFFVDNPRNRDVRGIKKREIQDLFRHCKLEVHRITLAPPIGRKVVTLSPLLYTGLAGLKALCTHYLIAAQKIV